MGAVVVELDLSIPFTAARARNAGFARLVEIAPEIAWVQFVDGDSFVEPNWLDRGRNALKTCPAVAIVSGQVRERYPERSIYNRLADLEWDVPAGETDWCGGIALMRSKAFQEVGGFASNLPAGEEPELCRRLIRAGWKILRLDEPMARHDLAMTSFAQWWRRQVRGSYGALDATLRFADSGELGFFRHQIRSTLVWVIGLPLGMLLGGGLGVLLVGPSVGLGVVGGFALVTLMQAARLAGKVRHRVNHLETALAFGLLTVLAKLPQAQGLLLYGHDRWRGRGGRLIEHKAIGTSCVAAASPR
jgi:cellulose synthase/poly-beta-1,6-N-acetylglucosamine synthase-like glycosyltransferase